MSIVWLNLHTIMQWREPVPGTKSDANTELLDPAKVWQSPTDANHPNTEIGRDFSPGITAVAAVWGFSP